MDHAPFKEEKFKGYLQTEWVGKPFIYLPETDSTNRYLKQLKESQAPHGTVVLSDLQSDGKGQYGREWISDACANLTFSILFRPDQANALPLLSLGVAYAALMVLERYSSEPVCLKWPNDLMISGFKVGGVLSETVFLGCVPERMITGIGLNLFQTDFPDGLKGKVISLSQIGRKPFSREKILAELLQEMEYLYKTWHLQPILLRGLIQQKLLGYGDWVKIALFGEIQPDSYKFIGINERGELLLLNEQLDVHTFSYEQIRIITGSQGVSETTEAVSS